MFSTFKEFSDDMINERDLYVVCWNMPRFEKSTGPLEKYFSIYDYITLQNHRKNTL